MQRRDFPFALAALAATVGGATTPALAADAEDGQGWRVLKPGIRPETFKKGHAWVYLFFSYACPHCAALAPSMEAWRRQLPADVTMNRLPVPFLANAANLQKLYFTLETLGVADDLHLRVFDAVQRDHLRLESESDLASFALAHDLEPQRFLSVFDSTPVTQRVQVVGAVMELCQIDRVPSVVVQGQYLVTPELAGSSDNVVPVLDQVVDRVRRTWS